MTFGRGGTSARHTCAVASDPACSERAELQQRFSSQSPSLPLGLADHGPSSIPWCTALFVGMPTPKARGAATTQALGLASGLEPEDATPEEDAAGDSSDEEAWSDPEGPDIAGGVVSVWKPQRGRGQGGQGQGLEPQQHLDELQGLLLVCVCDICLAKSDAEAHTRCSHRMHMYMLQEHRPCKTSGLAA